MLRASVIALLGLVFLAPVTQAGKMSVKYTVCRSSVATILSKSKEATVLQIDAKGLVVPGGTEVYKNATSRCFGVVTIIKGKVTGNGVCKYMAPDGDYLLDAWKLERGGQGTYKYIYGTGKWKGIKGGGKWKRVARGKPIAKGTNQSCVGVTGSYELTK